MPTSNGPEFQTTLEVEFAPVGDLAIVAHGLRKEAIASGRLIPNVKLTGVLRGNTCNDYILSLPEATRRARAAGAEMLLERSKFPTDLKYNEAISALAGLLTPIGLHTGTDERTKRYAVEAAYPGDGGPFGDVVAAKDEAEAEFQIRWTMTENAGYDVAGDPELFARVMRRHVIHDIQLETVSLDALKSLLGNLIIEVRSAGHSGPAFDAACETAEMLGFDIATAATPKL